MFVRPPISTAARLAVALAAGFLPCAVATVAHADGGCALTIYNEDFAVVRDTLPLNLTVGVNNVAYNDITYHVEPDSVILRDPTGAANIQVLEQNYRADPITQSLLLSLYEGKTIEFAVGEGNTAKIVKGTIIRSGYVSHPPPEWLYGQDDYEQQQMYQNETQPIIEVDGKLQFSLPGTPLFPALTNNSILKPTLDWTIQSDRAGPVQAELAYVTGGMTWKADYNIVSPTDGDNVDIIGWVTMDNESGRTFNNARIKLMAGDVNKMPSPGQNGRFYALQGDNSIAFQRALAPPVSEKTFDEYHLYTLDHLTTLRDREAKQVEFVHASGVLAKTAYVYDGAVMDPSDSSWTYDYIVGQRSYGTQSNPKVWTMREIVNSEQNHLGIPLPKGRVRFYREDTDGQLEFVGENEIDHTPKDETLRVYSGNAFDLSGDRKQTDYHVDIDAHKADESFEITLRNHKKAPAEIRVVEHLYRGDNWTISDNTFPYTKVDSHTIEFRVTVDTNQEQKVDYTAHYTW